MDNDRGETDEAPPLRSRLRELGFWLLGIVAFLVLSAILEDELGIPLATTVRIACACICLLFIYKLRTDFPREQWPRIGFWISLLVNIGIFFTPLVDRPTSRGELMLFASPDAIVVLAAMLVERILSDSAADVHQRAVRQQIILGLILAIAFCAILLTLVLIDSRPGH